MAIETIDDVILALDAILQRAWHDQNRIGYFAALYRRVTRAVKDGIARNQFANGPLMEKLDVVFAGRYLDALAAYEAKHDSSRSWKIAFDACADESRIILQHLLAGINAHINLDLGVAAAQVSPGNRIGELKADFDQINTVLAAQVGAVEAAMAAISPLVGTLSQVGLKSETTVINFNIELARQAAWTVAERLAHDSDILRAMAIDGLDLAVSIEGRAILYPPDKVQVLAAIREVELQDVRKVIDALTSDYPA